MKTEKLDGFGSLGVEITDIDLCTAGLEEVREIGRKNLSELVVVVPQRCVGGITLERYHEICMSWVSEPDGDFAHTRALFEKMVGNYGSERGSDGLPVDMSEDDRRMIEEGYRIRQGIEHLEGMSRVTGKRDEHGNTTGMFADGELEWHSNNQGAEARAPAVALLAWEGSEGSCTEYLNTVDPYNSLTQEWRSVCDELVAVHRWTPNVLAPGLGEIQQRLLRFNMCPEDDVEVPLVMYSPGGLKGLHFPFTTIHHFKGMSVEESAKIVEYLKAHVVKQEYIYAHHWRDGDLVFFDNSITLHRRPTKDCSKRLMYRMAFNYDALTNQKERYSNRAAQ